MSPMRFDEHTVVLPLLCSALFVAACEREPTAEEPALPYATEYPGVGYRDGVPQGRMGQLAESLRSDRTALGFGDRGYLGSLLEALEIDPSSQALVFSRTSLQTRNIGPETPRAIYFNDDTYVAWIPAAPSLEIANYDPALGQVFYSLRQEPDQLPERGFRNCLRCHDTYSLSGGGVPRFLLGSGYTGTNGELVSHEAWILTDQSTPFRSRWGGWYVTGQHGDAGHLGNIVVEQAEDLQDLESLRVGNLDDLNGQFDTSAYPVATSDIVALLILEHQVDVQNRLSRLRFEAAAPGPADPGTIEAPVEELVRSMLMLDAIALPAPIVGSNGFSAHFESLGPFDSKGRSLRELDLETRLFRYPLSYLIYAEGFAALPIVARRAVLDRIRQVLTSTPEADGFDRLTAADREAIGQILTETLEGFDAI